MPSKPLYIAQAKGSQLSNVVFIRGFSRKHLVMSKYMTHTEINNSLSNVNISKRSSIADKLWQLDEN